MSGSSFSPNSEGALPRVAIVGRPNVGKSTLFNRFAGSRIAITDPTPGVTRDPVEATCVIAGKPVVCIDTGGYRLESGDFDTLVGDRSLAAIDEADVVLLVLDVTELTPEDEELIEIVRERSRPTILVVNKVDNEQRELDAWNLHSLGFDHVVHVSAEHHRNFGRLESEIDREISLNSDRPRTTRARKHGADRAEIRLALLGKPNTGKSTLLNHMLDEERAIVSPIPGTTRDVIEGRFAYEGRVFSILDTAGIRRKRSVTGSVEYYSVNRAIASIDRADVILLVVDVQEGLSDQDKKIAAQIIKRGKGVILVFNKWDLMSDIPNAVNAVRDRARFVFPVLSFAPIIPVSALEGYGVAEVLEMSVTVKRQLETEIATGPLNRELQQWADAHPVPHGGGLRYTVKYMTQISSQPIRFVLFVNRKRGFPDSWISYLRNNLRRTFNLQHVPVSIELRES